MAEHRVRGANGAGVFERRLMARPPAKRLHPYAFCNMRALGRAAAADVRLFWAMGATRLKPIKDALTRRWQRRGCSGCAMPTGYWLKGAFRRAADDCAGPYTHLFESRATGRFELLCRRSACRRCGGFAMLLRAAMGGQLSWTIGALWVC